ncbi:hypothetical protein WN51_00008, partial [Melipona quadrifasciata]
AANTGIYIRYRVKSRVHGKTPYEIWYNKIPNIQEIKEIWMCSVCIEKGRKFELKTVKGIFMGTMIAKHTGYTYKEQGASNVTVM